MPCAKGEWWPAANAIHLDQMPAFDYDKLLWGERQIRSVANMTRQDARDFLAIAQELKIHPQAVAFPLQDANKALLAVKEETERGSWLLFLDGPQICPSRGSWGVCENPISKLSPAEPAL